MTNCGLCSNRQNPITRRDMLRHCGAGFGMVALAALLGEEASGQTADSRRPAPGPLTPKPPMFKARCKRIIHLFPHGGPSQVDTFDPKAILTRDSGKAFPYSKPRVQFSATGNLLKSPWEFKHYGQSGIEVSDLFP